MDKHQYEKQLILNKIDQLDKIEDSSLFFYRKTYIISLLKEAKDNVKVNGLTDELIQGVKEDILENFKIDFSNNEVEGFLKLNTNTLLTLINFGLDTESSGRIYDDLFNFILYDAPSPEYGHHLSEEETNKYFKLLKDVALFYGFKVV